jgi:hypothetical protein
MSKIKFEKSNRKNKKYKAIFNDGKIIHFGDVRYQHYKDRTPLKLYTHLNHLDKKRRKNFLNRMSRPNMDTQSARYLSIKYLW